MPEAAHARDWPGDFDPRIPAFAADPYPFYARLRQENPVHFVPAVGMWWVTRHRDAITVLQDSRFIKETVDREAQPPPPAPPPPFDKLAALPPSMLFRDPPDHTRLRSLVSKAFTPRTVERLRSRIEDLAAELLDQAEARGRMDVSADFAFPLPAIVIAELLGVPPEDREQFKTWSNQLAAGLDATQPQAVREQAMGANLALFEYFERLVEERRNAPRGDLMSELIAAEEQGDRLSRGELLSTCILLLIAGHETTTNLISAGTLALLEHPEQMELLRLRPELLPTAVEELLRWTSPVQRFARNVAEDVELGGKVLRRGDRVSAVIASANRDPEVFADPERLDVTRRENPHLAFGRGIHFCLGAPLARVEAPIAFRMLLERFPRLEPDGEPQWSPSTVLRGLRSLPVRW